MSSGSQVSLGYHSAREVTRRHARSFYFASSLLFGARRPAAYALYSFCRRLDDLVDGDAGAEGIDERLAAARQVISSLYRPSQIAQASSEWERLGFPGVELFALQDTVERFGIPQAPFQDLISGLQMDRTQSRYQSFEELDLYCYRVAGTVGLMLAPVLGCQDERGLGPAADLGRAMQLTNILRDIKEDLARGRVYLPLKELADFGVTEAGLREGRVDDGFRALMRFQVHRAREYYQRASSGVGYLSGYSAQRTVALMAALYGGILGRIERQGYDVFSQRAVVPFWSKLAIATRVLTLSCASPERALSADAGRPAAGGLP